METDVCRTLGVQAWRVVLICAAALFVSACATRYHSLDHGTGYSDSQVAPDEFRVSFQGNGNTNPEKADDFVLLCAAQVARQHGFPWFAVLDVTNNSSARPYTSEFRSFTGPMPAPYSPYDWGFAYGGNWATYQERGVYIRPGSTLRIKGYAKKPEKPFTYDAEALERSLAAKYRIPQARQ